ncbi:MAG: esterase family protein [Clostridia bacterium]|nr:esterase family protein [Clostridia bacterium]
MAFIQASFFSKALGTASTLWALIPEDAAGDIRVLTLLHGYSDDHTIWLRRTALERYTYGQDLAVIMPAVDHSYYCDEKRGRPYWDYVSRELPEVTEKLFRLAPGREGNFVAGLSMGGYGAMRLALTFPERYAAAGSFSGAVDIRRMAARKPDDAQRIFGGEDPEKTGADLYALMKMNASRPLRPRLYLSCGTEDFLYGEHCAFWPALEENGWDVTHREIPGRAHEWALWDDEVRRFIGLIAPEKKDPGKTKTAGR